MAYLPQELKILRGEKRKAKANVQLYSSKNHFSFLHQSNKLPVLLNAFHHHSLHVLMRGLLFHKQLTKQLVGALDQAKCSINVLLKGLGQLVLGLLGSKLLGQRIASVLRCCKYTVLSLVKRTDYKYCNHTICSNTLNFSNSTSCFQSAAAFSNICANF